MQATSTTENGQHPRPKRVKISNACDECKRQKIKCDERRLACANCDRKFGANAPNQCNRTVTQKHHAKVRNSRARKARTLLPAQAYAVETGAATGPTGSTNAREIPEDENGIVGPVDPDEDRADEASTAMLGQVNPERRASSFFGGSSVGCFLQQIQNMVKYKPLNPMQTMVYSPMPIDNSEAKERSKTKLINYVLPPRRLANTLLQIYWTSIYPLYPFLDHQRIDSNYHKLWSGATKKDDEQTFVCTINTVFALATRLCNDIAAPDREQLANEFYDRAVSAMDLARFASVTSVQCYLLRAQYLQSTDDHHQCWLLVGLAVRTAQSLGLHTAQVSDSIHDYHEQQLLRRVWHGCILMDRITAMAYGRPPLVYKGISENVSLPDVTPLDQADTAKDLSFFVESLKLFRILWAMLAYLYPHNSPELRFDYLFGYGIDSSGDGRRRSVLALDDDLSRWRQQLPDHLLQLPRPSETGVVQRQATMLHQRYVHVRIVTLRPVLSAFILAEAADAAHEVDRDSLSYHLAHQAAVICIKLAQEAISIVSDRVATDTAAHKTLSESWYNEMYVYTAGTVLIAGLLTPTLRDAIGKEALEQSWAAAKYALYAYKAFRKKTRYLLNTLELLYESLPSRYENLKQSHRNALIQTIGTDIGRTTDSDVSGAARQPSSPDTMAQHPPNDIGIAGVGEIDILDQVFDPNDLSWLNDFPLDLTTSFGVGADI